MTTGLSEKAYRDFSGFIKNKLGIVLGENKQYLVRSRLSSVLRSSQYLELDHLVSDIVTGMSRDLQSAALYAMTTNETFWFRDKYPFIILNDVVLDEIASRQRHLRIWSAACSTGQEPYSIAMAILEHQKHASRKFDSIEIVATDFSLPVLEKASKGIYDELAVSRGLNIELLQKFFIQQDPKTWQICDDVKKMVKFRQFNLLDQFGSLGQFDIVFCRNVLIYFDAVSKANILQKLSAQLPQSGVLFLGAAESIASADQYFKMQKQPQGLYYTRTTP